MPAYSLSGNFTHGSLLSTVVMSRVRARLADAAKNDLVVPGRASSPTAAGPVIRQDGSEQVRSELASQQMRINLKR